MADESEPLAPPGESSAPPPDAESTAAPAAGPAIPEELAIMPLRGGVVYPFTVVPLQVGQPRSLQLLDDVMRDGRLLGLVGQRRPEQENAGPDDCYTVGTVGRIVQLMRQPEGGGLMVAVQGLERIRIAEWTQREPYLRARITAAPDTVETTAEVEALRRLVADEFARMAAIANLPDELVAAIAGLDDPRSVAYLVASSVRLDPEARQEILELDSVAAKLERLARVIGRELEILELGKRIQSSAQEQMTKTQREYFLREQMRAIRKELGESEEGGESADLRRRLDEAGLPEEARREADRELSRLESLPAASPEHGLIRNYLDWLASLPWNRLTGAQHRRGAGAPGARRGPLRPGQDQGSDPGVPGRAEAARRAPGPGGRVPGGPGVQRAPCPTRSAFARPRRFASRFSASSGRPASARPRWRSPSPARWAASTCASRSAACATRRRSAATAGPTSARCRGGSSRACAAPRRPTRCSCWTRSTS